MQGGEASVNAVSHGLEFSVCARFHDTPASDDNVSIRVPHGGESVSDDKRSAPSHQTLQRILNHAFALGIQGEKEAPRDCLDVMRKLDERFPELFGFNFWSDAGFYSVVGNQNGKELMSDSRIVTLDSQDKLKRPALMQK